MAFVDLHCHSTASDGSLSPEEVVQLAKRNGLSGMALTDHDTIGGLGRARAEAEKIGVRFLAGIEISATYPSPGTLHVLGYGVEVDSPVLGEMTRGLIEARDDRNPQIVQKLNALGVAISMAEVEAEAKGGVVGRPHMAAILVRKGYVSSVKAAFDKYLGQGGLAYFDKERLAPRRAFELIREAGGVPVLAHPVQLRTGNDAELERVVKDLLDFGLEGIEVMHSDHSRELVEKYSGLAEKFGLIKTGGSDFHGRSKAAIELGWANGMRVPGEWMEVVVERSEKSKVKSQK